MADRCSGWQGCGLLHLLGLMVEATMIAVCWAGENLEGLLKFLTFIELASANMFAITNLAICVNLALIVMSHRTLSTVKAASSSVLIVMSLVISVGTAAASASFWDTMVLTGTTSWPVNATKRTDNWINISMFYVEFFVGVCMLLIVTWLLLFWTEEVKGCWKVHARIRYYFGLTLIGTAVNLALGVCGVAFVVVNKTETIMVVLTWTFRYMHIALDTFVLYGVLGVTTIDEGSDLTSSGRGPSGSAGARISKKSSSMTSNITRNQYAFSNNGLDQNNRKVRVANNDTEDKYRNHSRTAVY